MADIKGIEAKEYQLPLWCSACAGLTKHQVKRTMPYSTPKGLRVRVYSKCMRCEIKLEARRDNSTHVDVWTVDNFNHWFDLTWVGGNTILKLEHAKRRQP